MRSRWKQREEEEKKIVRKEKKKRGKERRGDSAEKASASTLDCCLKAFGTVVQRSRF